MIRKFLAIFILFNMTACAELQQVVNNLPQGGALGNTEIASALRQALDLGVDKQVTKLTQQDGFFKNELVKILLPAELQKVDKALRDIGNNDAATQYLTSKTQDALYIKFSPVIKNSFNKVGADDIWNNLIQKYNAIPFTNNVNPDLTDYVTHEALKGVFTMIAMEEKDIRTKISSRSTDLLKKVFALQD